MTAVAEPRSDPPAAPVRAAPARPLVVDLDDARATDVALVGGKAAALARARQAGLDTVPGVVLTTVVSEVHDAGTPLTDLVTDGAHGVGRAVAGLGDGPLAVRSSSVVEDAAASSAAGQFATVLGVEGDDALVAAVDEVLRSRSRAGAAEEPIAVLVQPMVRPEVAGVAFGVDPVSGRTDRRVVTAVRGSPEPLVSGEVDGSRWVLDDHDRVVEEADAAGVGPARARLSAVVALLRRADDLFGGPQDIEWALVEDRLLLLQSRPVTTVVRGVPSGPVYGPGPVAETFPEALAPLEEDLWAPPLRDAVRQAVRIAGSVPERTLADRDLVVTIGGRVALDLDITGEDGAPGRWRRRVAVAANVRRLRAAWRVGRLQLALPLVADDLARTVDADLEAVPDLSTLTGRQLVALADRGREALRSLHAHEILLGLVADPGESRFTGGSIALRVLAEARREGLTDGEIVRRAPVVLALVAPAIGRPLVLPSDASVADLTWGPPGAPDAQVRREALRLRVRWVQELVGQAAFEVGRRLARRGVLAEAEHVRFLRFDEVVGLVTGTASVDPRLVADRAAEHAGSPPLPARFQVGDRGLPIAVDEPGRAGGTGAGGGSGQGPVTHDADDPPPGSVLVVEALTPGLGPLLPRLAGLVSETGSVLSHLAILAREAGIPTVVGRRGAVADLADGTVVRVDGQTGEVATDAAEVGR